MIILASWSLQAVREAEERQRAVLEAGPRPQQLEPQPKAAPPAPGTAKRKPAIPLVRVKPAAAKAASPQRPSQAGHDRGGGNADSVKRQKVGAEEAGTGGQGGEGAGGLGGLLGAYGSDSEDDL